jgi:predicted DNA-binding ribbon-helix-helix protein
VPKCFKLEIGITARFFTSIESVSLPPQARKQAMQRRIINIDTHPIYGSIEGQFWDCLEDIAAYRGKC